MRRIMVLVVAMMLWGMAIPSAAQGNLQYAVAYGGGKNNAVIVAALLAGNMWRFTALEDTYFAQADVTLLTPDWSPDGKLYMGGKPEETTERTQFRRIIRYDANTDQASTLVEFAANEGYQVMDFALSPDGRHLLSSDLANSKSSYLVDAVTGDILNNLGECYKMPRLWTANYLVTANALCPFDINVYRLPSAERLATLPEAQAEAYIYADWYVLPNGRQAIAHDNVLYVIDLLNLKGAVLMEGISHLIQVDAQRMIYALNADRSLHWLDLNTLKSTPIGSYEGELLGGFAQNGKVYLWQLVKNEADELSLLTIQGEEIQRQPSYRGQIIGAKVAATFAAVIVFTLDNQEIVLNGFTGERIKTSDAREKVISLSPDMKWALIAVANYEINGKEDELYALELATNTRVDFPLLGGYLPHRNFHFDREAYYVWWSTMQTK